jgi:hypothetical protein
MVIYAMRRPSWEDSATTADFEPFSWEQNKKD